MNKKSKNIAVIAVSAIWVFGLFLLGMIMPDREVSLSERRKLAAFPKMSAEALLDGSFMSEFEKYSADQFPLREGFRRVKAIGEYGIFRQLDSNGIYLYKGYAAQLEYPLDEESVKYAAGRIAFIYEKFLKDRAKGVYLSVVPDKGYFMRDSGAPCMDYDRLVSIMTETDGFAEYIDIFPTLELSDYYKTDTHWRTEEIGDTAKALAEGMGAKLTEEYEAEEIDTEFYGVYYGRSSLPMPGERMYILKNKTLDGVKVYNLEEQGYTEMFDLERADGADPYEIYLSGPRSCMTIENPNADGGTLIIIRDSFGSSIAPYFAEAYKKVVLLDIRYLPAPMLNRYVDFDGADVLFMYSTLILNNSDTLS